MTTGGTEKDKPVLKDAPPAWHSVAIMVLLASVFIKIFPSMESIDEVATIETFTNRMFPDLISIKVLGYIRLCIAICIWFTSYYTIYHTDGAKFHGSYHEKSKLKNLVFNLKGWKSLAPMTHWSWLVLGISFSLSSAIALDVAYDVEHHISTLMLRIALLSYEIAAPIAFLVSAVVKYSIWPQIVTKTGNTGNLQTPTVLMMHNANTIFSLIELCLLGGLPVRMSDIAIGPLYGVVYHTFAWSMRNKWRPPEDGPQFLYHFMDTTMPKIASIAIIVLLTVLMVAYFIFAHIHLLIDMVGGGIIGHSICVIAISSLVCRVR